MNLLLDTHVFIDPFDRMLICQAMHHGLTIVSLDDQIATYPVSVIPPV